MPKKNPIFQARIYGEPPFAFCQTRHHRHHLKSTQKYTLFFFIGLPLLFICLSGGVAILFQEGDSGIVTVWQCRIPRELVRVSSQTEI